MCSEMDRKWENELEAVIPSVKKILVKKHGLVLPTHCDEFVVRCLRSKDGIVDKAVKLILSYQNTIAELDVWGVPFKPTAYTEFYKNGALAFLRQRDSIGRRVFIVRSKFWDPKVFSYEAIIIALWLMCEHFNGEFEDIQRDGYVTIWDFSNFSWQQVWAINQWRLLTAAKWAQNGVGGRIRAFHIIFHPKAIGLLYAGMRPFLKEKIRQRIFFHSSLEDLHNHINPKILPNHLGGELSAEEASDNVFLNQILRKDKYFQELKSDGFPPK